MENLLETWAPKAEKQHSSGMSSTASLGVSICFGHLVTPDINKVDVLTRRHDASGIAKESQCHYDRESFGHGDGDGE